jgi:hypothetical protein
MGEDGDLFITEGDGEIYFFTNLVKNVGLLTPIDNSTDSRNVTLILEPINDHMAYAMRLSNKERIYFNKQI